MGSLKKLISFGGLLLALSCALPALAKTYSTAQGRMDLNVLGQTLADQLQVEIEQVKLSEQKDIYRQGTQNVSNYVLQFRMNQKHKATCELTLFAIVQQGMIYDCKAPTGEFRLTGFIDYSDLGL